MDIPYVNLKEEHRELKDELMKAIDKVIDSGQFILGKEGVRFEEEMARRIGVKHAIGVNSGTDALFLTLKALNIGKGDEVITVSNSFLATCNAIRLTGATPIFVDVKEDYLINPEKASAAITDKTKAIIPVHLTGRPCDMEALGALCKKHNLVLIEDAAQAFGATWDEKPVGSFGIGCFSMHPLKNLNACGDAGMVTADDDAFAERLRLLRNHGLKNRDEAVLIGHNSRLDEMQAAILNVKILHIDEMTERIRKIAHWYQEAFTAADIKEVEYVPHDAAREKAVYHTFIIRVKERDALQAHLKKGGIDTKVHYPLAIHQQESYKEMHIKGITLANTEKQTQTILSLPIYPALSQEQVRKIVEHIAAFYQNR